MNVDSVENYDQIELNDYTNVDSMVQIVPKSQVTLAASQISIPYWTVPLACLFICYSLSILAASISFLTAGRPGLYMEDCKMRSCASGFGLKCINTVCDCPLGFYYTNKCHAKKLPNSFCHRTDECMIEKGLLCFNGKCVCNRTQYWSGMKCVDRVTYGESCFNAKCVETTNLICDQATKLCTCNETIRFWNGHACYNIRNFNEKCVSSQECYHSLGFACVSGLCKCNSVDGYFYDYFTQQCLACKSPWTQLNDMCLHYDNRLLDWTNARDTCLQMNSSLVETKSEEHIRSFEVFIQNVSTISDGVWVGIFAYSGFDFRWISDNSSYFNGSWWGGGQPDGGYPSESCVRHGFSNQLKFGDLSCSQTRRFVCQKFLFFP